MRKTLTVVLLLVCVLSCKNKVDVLTEDQLVDVLVDYHLAEGVVFSPDKTTKNHSEKLEVYNHVFEKHGISKQYFDSTLNYYIAQPKLLQDIYGRVTAELRIVEKDIKAFRYASPGLNKVGMLPIAIKQADSAEFDSVVAEIWPLMRKYDLPAQGIKSRLAFNFPIEVDSFDFVVLKADVKIYADDNAEEPFSVMFLNFEDGTKKKVRTNLQRGDEAVTIRLRLNSDSLMNVERISGFILDHAKCVGKKHAKVDNVRLYLMRSELRKSRKLKDSNEQDSIKESTILLGAPREVL